jgi:heme oxygenase (biliverdin-producing, ferredoxin)
VSGIGFVETMKEETFEAHEKSKDSGFAVTLMSGQWSHLAFIEWQRALYPIYVTLEEIMKANRKDPSLHIFDHRKLDRSQRIFNDLAHYGVDPVAEPSTLPSVKEYVSKVQDAGSRPQRIMAYHYTRYMGDMIGGQVIARSLMEHYEMPAEALTCYDFKDIGDIYHYRKTYKILLDLVPWSKEEREAFVEEAKVAYEINAILFGELYELLSEMHQKA